MTMRTDPFRQLERMTQNLFAADGPLSRLTAVPMDAYRQGEEYVIRFDLPGVALESIDVNVERNVLTVRAERASDAGEDAQWRVAERQHGTFTRQVTLGETLDTDRIAADYDAGVLTVRIPVSQKAQPRKITVTGAGQPQQIDA